MSNPVNISTPILEYQPNSSCSTWELPSWGHPLSQGVMPLFVGLEDRLFPVGSVFTVGRGVCFAITALHCITAVLDHTPHLKKLYAQQELPSKTRLPAGASLWLFHQNVVGSKPGSLTFHLWPLEFAASGEPTDVSFCTPQFQTSFGTLALRLGFDIPSLDQTVWSIGYTDFMFPEHGIPMVEVREGKFDWQRDYSHKFLVIQGKVSAIFMQRYLRGFVDAPCFTFNEDIPPALSGGPVMRPDGVVIGVNSAAAGMYSDGPMSIASLIYPLLIIDTTIEARQGQLNLRSNQPILNWVDSGHIPTDGSHTRVTAMEQDAIRTVKPHFANKSKDGHYDDLHGLQTSKPAESDGTFHHISHNP